jgi:hypothetical protein
MLPILKIGNRTLHNINLRIQIPSHTLQHHNIGQERGKLPIQLHIIIPNGIEHARQQLHPLQIVEVLIVYGGEDVQQGLVVGRELAGLDLAVVVGGEGVDHLGAAGALRFDY